MKGALPFMDFFIQQIIKIKKKRKGLKISLKAFSSVGVTRFELATTRPPDAYSKPD